jgi:hypothetical protein
METSALDTRHATGESEAGDVPFADAGSLRREARTSRGERLRLRVVGEQRRPPGAARPAVHDQPGPLEVRRVHTSPELEIDIPPLHAGDDERRVIHVGGNEERRRTTARGAAPPVAALPHDQVPRPVAREHQGPPSRHPALDPGDDGPLAPGGGGQVGEFQEPLLGTDAGRSGEHRRMMADL